MKNEGGPAFPETACHSSGLTMREYYAGQALIGLLAGSEWRSSVLKHDDIAKACWRLADAMLNNEEQ